MMKTKQALDAAVGFAAAHTNRVRALLAIAQEMPESQFERLAGQHPDTLERDLTSARQDYERVKAEYEAHCLSIGVPAYATYNED